jgi:asparagine synthase (glutamine-hydrolysing)
LNYDNLGNIRQYLENIQYYLTNSVKKIVTNTECPIACLLSGGLNSSLITSLVNEYYNESLETYSIGMEGSEDLKNARLVANYLQTKHTEILLTEEDIVNAIPEVIKCIESYDTTTVKASIGNFLLGKYISENSEAKVIFNGCGADELCGGYLYMNLCPDSIEFDKECRRLLTDIHMFDLLRSDKCISSHGLDPKTPFLDRSWVQYYLSLPPILRFNTNKNNCEKYLLRSAFSKEYFLNIHGFPLLPDNILWRRKEEFSDRLSKESRY